MGNLGLFLSGASNVENKSIGYHGGKRDNKAQGGFLKLFLQTTHVSWTI